jgi:hypothetical protein
VIFSASAGFSGTQGHLNWFYRDTSGAMDRFDSSIWKGTEDYLWLWESGGHPGATRDAVRRFVVPADGFANITSTVAELNPTCGDGVTVSVMRGTVLLWHRDRPKGSPPEAFTITTPVVAGDTLDFVIGRRGDNGCDSTEFNPTIALTPTAGGPTAPRNIRLGG